MTGKLTARTVAALKPKSKYFNVNDSDLKGFVLRVQPSGIMTYFVRYRLPSGRRGTVKIGPADALTPDQARKDAQTKLADAVRGDDPAAERRRGIAMTLGEFIEGDYARVWLSQRRSGKATQARLKAQFKQWWTLPMDRITHGTVERWRAGRKADGLAVATINRDVVCLKAALNKARQWGLLAVHPLEQIKAEKVDSLAIVRYLTDDEKKRLDKALDEREERLRKERESYNEWLSKRNHVPLPDLRSRTFADYLKPLVLTAMHTGLRRGELFALDWNDIDFDGSTLTVSGKTAKSGKTRHVPMNTFIRGVLEQWHEQGPGRGLVFPSPATGGRLDNCNTAWEAVLADAKITAFRFHDLRHHFASSLVMAGVDLNTVRDLLGHGNITMTLRYSHLSPSVKSAAVERLVVPEGKVLQFQKGKRK